ncbi:MAG: ABC transporter ATP-binding protein [Limisphaerales bacterium]
MATLEVRSLTKWYGPVRGIEGVSFTLERGEIFGYLGPNGAGKTTTLRCIMGLIRPGGGEVLVLGEPVVAGRATQHDRIGYLPGEFRLWPGFCARRSLRVLASLGAGDGAEQRRRQLAERLELNLDRAVGELSKGNRQKAAVVYAFQHQPELLILDEPTSGLDPLVRQTVLDLIREAAREGATVLLSSHDLSEVGAVCERVAIVRAGRLVEMAPVWRIVQGSEHRLKVWFVGGEIEPPVPLGRLPGVRVIEQRPGLLDLAYQGACEAVLRWVAQFPVERIATPQTSLEEAFIEYYKAGPGAGPAAEADSTSPTDP